MSNSSTSHSTVKRAQPPKCPVEDAAATKQAGAISALPQASRRGNSREAVSPGAAWRPRPPAAAPLPPPATPPAGSPAASPPTPPTAVARLLSVWPNHTDKVDLLCSRSRYNDAMAQPDMTEKTSPHLPGELLEPGPDPLDEAVPPDVRPRAASARGAAVVWLRGLPGGRRRGWPRDRWAGDG